MVETTHPQRNPLQPNQKIRLLIVDDHPVVLVGLRTILEAVPDFEVVAACTNRDDAINTVRSQVIDVAIFDLELHGIREWSAIDQIRTLKPELKIIVLSFRSEDDVGLEAVARTRCGFLSKELAPELLEDYVRRAQNGEIVASANLQQLLLKHRNGEDVVEGKLTQDQWIVFQMLGEGLTISQIAERLHRANDTIHHHCQNIRERLGLSSQHELVVFAIRYFIKK